MFKRRSQRNEAKNQKRRELWGRDFDIVASGLDEAQVVSFVNDLLKRYEDSSSPSARSVIKAAVADAEQILAGIKMRAQAEAEEEVARIIAQANQDAEKIRGSSEAVAEKETESIPETTASREVEAAETGAQQDDILRAVREMEESAQPQLETAEEVEEPAQVQEDTIVEKIGEPVPEGAPEPGEVEPSEPSSPETEQEIGPDLMKESYSLYTGEVELAVANPVAPKMVAKLYGYLQTTPEIKFVRTSGSWDRGTTITIVLDKPIPLVSVLSSKIPEAKVVPERPEKDGFVKGRKGVRRISLALKEA